RFSSPTLDVGDPRIGQALPASYVNLLANSGFESGLTNWTVNTSATTGSANPSPYVGNSYFAPGFNATGFAQQTIDLLAAGFTTAQLDSQDFVTVFGGRIRSLSEAVVDRGQILLTYQDGSGAAIGSALVVVAQNTTDRWELVG